MSQSMFINPPIATQPPVIIIPLPTPTPSSLITVHNPPAGATLTAGSSFTLTWSISINREFTVDILLSTGSGPFSQVIAKGIPNNNVYKLTVPNTLSDQCQFRINVWFGNEFVGYNLSPVFRIVPPPTATPKPTVTPKPTATPAPSPSPSPTIAPSPTPLQPIEQQPPAYSPDDGLFISNQGDATRWFRIEHTLDSVDHIVWQIARSEFPCDPNIVLDETPGLLAQGQLSGAATEFKLDFASIVTHLEHRSDDPILAQVPDNQGESYEIISKVVISQQSQRVIYIRAILFDKNNKVIGITGSDFQISYGAPHVDMLAAQSDWPISEFGRPVLSARTTPGFDATYDPFEPISEDGLFIYTGFDTDWKFELGEIPEKATTIDLQIATVPFKTASQTDWQEPAGLIYREIKTHTYIRQYFNVSFADFATLPMFRSDGTSVYYIRAVCSVPGVETGTVIPVATKTHKIVYTGDLVLYMASQYDPADMPPEELEVKSNVPNTEFLRYSPVKWPLKDDKEYFEVTRRIQAEELCFYIKNHQTGDFLYPYNVHMYFYPQTTRAQYQATLDRMLPPGAWFHLTIHQSDWDAFWGEFFDLLTQIYASIQNTYNNLKYTVADTIANQFAFLGSGAQAYIRSAVVGLINYGMASVGLPPSLPNFETLAEQGLDYCVQVALNEAASTAGVTPEELPPEIRHAITNEMKDQLSRLARMNTANPLNVDYLKPAVQAMYQPAYVDVKVFNHNSEISPPGTLTFTYYPTNAPHFKLYKYVSLPIPPMRPHGSTFIRVFLKPDHTDLPIWKDYYWGKTGTCQFKLTVKYDLPDIEVLAAEQGVSGSMPGRPVAYYYDRDPVYEIVTITPPFEPFYD
ncbi:MAG: GPI anchored serine-threonine rich family protein [Bacillota bacterium]|nr:GPI anchored serine-threonine rich family protein [Bacillota bacterium]